VEIRESEVSLLIYKIRVCQSLVHDHFCHGQSDDAVGSCLEWIPGIAFCSSFGHPYVKRDKLCTFLDPGKDQSPGKADEKIMIGKRVGTEIENRAAFFDIFKKSRSPDH